MIAERAVLDNDQDEDPEEMRVRGIGILFCAFADYTLRIEVSRRHTHEMMQLAYEVQQMQLAKALIDAFGPVYVVVIYCAVLEKVESLLSCVSE
jgi:hypothetical protein